MKNFVEPGDTIVVAAPANVSAGAGVLVGAIFGIAVTDALNGENVPIKTVGVFDLPKAASQAWTQGVRVYWDNSGGEATTTATSNYPIGIATEAVAGGATDTIGRVRLDGIATAAAA